MRQVDRPLTRSLCETRERGREKEKANKSKIRITPDQAKTGAVNLRLLVKMSASSTTKSHIILLAIIGTMIAIDTLFRHSSSRSFGGNKQNIKNNLLGRSYRSLDSDSSRAGRKSNGSKSNSLMTFDDTTGIVAAKNRLRKTPLVRLSAPSDIDEDFTPDSSSESTETIKKKLSSSSSSSSSKSKSKIQKITATEEEEEKEEDQPTPAIAWLLSYPNSGTSFTLQMVQKASSRAVATNYGQAESNFYNPLHLQPPFWNGPEELPSTYLLTQTHCGGCHDCKQQRTSAFVLPTKESFLMDCSYAYKSTASGKKISISYSPERVEKVVHLIRNPFHNIAAKFQRVQRLTSEYHKTATGFRKWCKDVDQKADGGKNDMSQKLKSVPCHSELFKYVHWHNLAHETLESLKVPYMTVHYEHYANQTQEDTVSSLLDFLELEFSEKNPVLEPFVQKPTTEYDSYFPDHQIDAITYFVQKLASSATWNDIKDYFPAPSLLQSSIISIALRPQDMKSKIGDTTAVNWIASIDEALDNPQNLEGLWVQ